MLETVHKAWEVPGKHNFRRLSFNYPLHFLTVFRETKALLFCQLTQNSNAV